MELHLHLHSSGDVHIHQHNHHDDDKILSELKSIKQNQFTMAKKIDEINEVMSEINESTNNIAADLDRLADQAEGGLSAEEATSHVANLRSTSQQLKAIASKNPETGEPTPPVEPTEPTV
jgi:hypothetical protein